MRALRTLLRQRQLVVVATLSLAIAMALGILGLSAANTMLLLPLAAPDPGRLVSIYSTGADRGIDEISYPDLEYYRANNHVFTGIAASPHSISLSVDRSSEGLEIRIIARPVSANYFDVLGIRPLRGRFFTAGDDRENTHVAVMTYACWRRLGFDPNIVGKTVAGNNIVGVTPPSFTGSLYGLDGDVLYPLSQLDNTGDFEKREARQFFLIARLKPGVSRRQAQAEMTMLARQLAEAYPAADKDRTAVVTRASLLPPDALAGAQWVSGVVLALIVLVLLIASANVADLLIAAAAGRRQEAAIKLALGAPRGRLIREFLVESGLLCAAGGLLGFAIAGAVVARFKEFTFVFPMYGPYTVGLNLHLDATVAALAVGLVLLATLATGLAPALYGSSPHLAQMLAGEIAAGGGAKSRRRRALVAVQVAVCTLVLTGLGLCLHNLSNLRHADLGFTARNLIAHTIYLQGEGFDERRGKAFYDTLRRAAEAIPRVESVALASDMPLFGVNEMAIQRPESVETTSIARSIVDTGYFGTLRMRLLAGRNFAPSDREGAPAVVIVNRRMAETFWPGADPIGKTIAAVEPPRRFTVVGVAADAKYDEIDEAPRPFLYLPLAQNYSPGINVIVRTTADPRGTIEPLQKAIGSLGIHIPARPATFDDWISLSLFPQRAAAVCVGVLSALGMALAMVGLFAAVSYSVRERKKELGIRIALGAGPGRLLRLLLGETASVAGAGIGIGIALGIAATAGFRSLFYGIGVVDWMVLIPVAAAMLAVCLAVAAISARPWLHIDAMDTIRHA
jgi:putative ABC transport system permease protein